MEQDKALETLVEKFGKEDWFHSVEIDPLFGKDIVVYAKYMNTDVLTKVPMECEKKRVVLSYASYKEAATNKFCNIIAPSTMKVYVAPTEIAPAPIKVEEVVAPIEVKETKAEPKKDTSEVIIGKLLPLKKMCDEKTLQTIFWELRDEENKEKPITFVSKDFPKVRNELQKLYTEYGYDALIELVLN